MKEKENSFHINLKKDLTNCFVFIIITPALYGADMDV